MTKPEFRSAVAEAVHEGVSGMHRLGLVDIKTTRAFDICCLMKVEAMKASDICA